MWSEIRLDISIRRTEMKKEMRWLAILNIAFSVIFGYEAVAQLKGQIHNTIAEKIAHADCKATDCNGTISSSGEDSTLASGCTWDSATSTCSGTCHRCNGSNPFGRTEICVNVTTDEECQPDGRDASFTCGTGDAKQCNAASGDSSLSCCSTNDVTPAAAGGSCGGNTCLKI